MQVRFGSRLAGERAATMRSARRRRIGAVCGLKIAAMTVALAIGASAAKAAPPVRVDVAGDLVSLAAGGPVSIATILVELGAATGVTVAVRSGKLVGPLAIEDTPVVEMFNRLAAGHDVAMRFADGKSGSAERLVSVWVLERSPAASRGWKASPPQAYRAEGTGPAAEDAADQAERAQVTDLVGRGEAGVPGLQRLLSSRASPGGASWPSAPWRRSAVGRRRIPWRGRSLTTIPASACGQPTGSGG